VAALWQHAAVSTKINSWQKHSQAYKLPIQQYTIPARHKATKIPDYWKPFTKLFSWSKVLASLELLLSQWWHTASDLIHEQPRYSTAHPSQ